MSNTIVEEKNLTIFNAVKVVFLYLNKKERILGFFISLGNIFASLLETLALVSVMPVVNLIVNGSVQDSHSKVVLIYNFFNKPTFIDFVFYLTFCSIMLLLSSVIFSIFMQWAVERFKVKCQNRLAEILSLSIINASYEWHLSKSGSGNSHHLFHDILSWSNGGIYSILSFFSNASLLISLCFVILYSMGLDGFSGLILIGILGIIIVNIIKPLIKKKSHEQREYHITSYSTISEILLAIKDIKLSNKFLFFTLEYIDQFAKFGKAKGLLKIYKSLPFLVFLFVGQCTILLVAVFMLGSGMSGSEVATKIALIVLIMGKGIPAVNKILNDYVHFSNAMPSLISLIQLKNEIEIINTKSLKKSNPEKLNWNIFKYRNVSFKYKNQSKDVLKNINLEIQNGKTYCIIGKTGAGKTTFLDLFLGLLQPTKGKVSIDNKNIDKVRNDLWKEQIAYVPQNTVILNKDPYQNVALGSNKQEINKRRIDNILKDLDLYEELIIKNNNSSLGDLGKKISGGQRQRLSFARALYKNLPILVLDEITSALDDETEKIIINIINKLKGNITILCVTHRKNFLNIADDVLEINKGYINKIL